MMNSNLEPTPGPEQPVSRRDAQFDAVESFQPVRLIGEDELSPPHGSFEQRRPHMFPRLGVAHVEEARRFGTLEYWKAGDVMFRAGEASLGIRILLRGSVLLTRSDGLGRSSLWAELSDRQFLGETAQLMGKPHLVNGYATTDVEALLIPPERIRALLVEQAQLGEQIMRALIMRRAGLVQDGIGPLLIGSPADANLVALEGFFRRVNHPYRLVNAASDAETLAFLEKLPDWEKSTPIVLLADGTTLHNPDEHLLAAKLGLLLQLAPSHVYDVAVVGAGPAGLATAVYAASEGLSVVVFDARGPGGQAGASTRIENYLGFPTGIPGNALAYRAFLQAVKFGAHIQIPTQIGALDCAKTPFELQLADSRRIMARTVVIATGAAYRCPTIGGRTLFNLRGVYYWASSIEGRLCKGAEVVLIGGGNSAGQAIVFLATFASRIHVLIRKPGLESSMSRYLVDRIKALHNVVVHANSEIEFVACDSEGLASVAFQSPEGEQAIATRFLFLFTGADPNTGWLQGCGVEVDEKGFVMTGHTGEPDSVSRRFALQTSIPGVFAAGDVRSSSVKRVSAAVGEGAAVVAEVHAYLSHAT